MTIWVADQNKPVEFTVHAIVTTSDLELSPSEVDFGYCTIYEAIRTEISLHNHSLLPQEFGFVKLPKVPPAARPGARGARLGSPGDGMQRPLLQGAHAWACGPTSVSQLHPYAWNSPPCTPALGVQPNFCLSAAPLPLVPCTSCPPDPALCSSFWNFPLLGPHKVARTRPKPGHPSPFPGLPCYQHHRPHSPPVSLSHTHTHTHMHMLTIAHALIHMCSHSHTC
nr:uncharacterized protein LOC119623706 [Chlorocebus sabaeus]